MYFHVVLFNMLHFKKLHFFGEHPLFISCRSQFKEHLHCNNCTYELKEALGDKFLWDNEEGSIQAGSSISIKKILKTNNQIHCCKNDDSYWLYYLRFIQNRSSQYN